MKPFECIVSGKLFAVTYMDALQVELNTMLMTIQSNRDFQYSSRALWDKFHYLNGN